MQGKLQRSTTLTSRTQNAPAKHNITQHRTHKTTVQPTWHKGCQTAPRATARGEGSKGARAQQHNTAKIAKDTPYKGIQIRKGHLGATQHQTKPQSTQRRTTVQLSPNSTTRCIRAQR